MQTSSIATIAVGLCLVRGDHLSVKKLYPALFLLLLILAALTIALLWKNFQQSGDLGIQESCRLITPVSKQQATEGDFGDKVIYLFQEYFVNNNSVSLAAECANLLNKTQCKEMVYSIILSQAKTQNSIDPNLVSQFFSLLISSGEAGVEVYSFERTPDSFLAKAVQNCNSTLIEPDRKACNSVMMYLNSKSAADCNSVLFSYPNFILCMNENTNMTMGCILQKEIDTKI